MIKGFLNFIKESNVSDTYAFHFTESDNFLKFWSSWKISESEEISEILNNLFDDFNIDFDVTPSIILGPEVKIGEAKKVIRLIFKKKYDHDPTHTSYKNLPLSVELPKKDRLSEIKKVSSGLHNLSEDLNRIYLEIERITKMTDYTIDDNDDNLFNDKISTGEIKIDVKLHSEYLEISGLSDCYNNYIKSEKIDPKIEDWYLKSMSQIKKSIKDVSSISYQFLDHDGDGGYWDIYVFDGDEYYSLARYDMSSGEGWVDIREINRVKKDLGL